MLIRMKILQNRVAFKPQKRKNARQEVNKLSLVGKVKSLKDRAISDRKFPHPL